MNTRSTPIHSNQSKISSISPPEKNPSPPPLHQPPFTKNTRKNATIRRFQLHSDEFNKHKAINIEDEKIEISASYDNSITTNMDNDDNDTMGTSSSVETTSLYTDTTSITNRDKYSVTKSTGMAEKIKEQQYETVQNLKSTSDKRVMQNELLKYNQELSLLQNQEDDSHHIGYNASIEDATTIGSLTAGTGCYYPEMMSITSSQANQANDQQTDTNNSKNDALLLLSQVLQEQQTNQQDNAIVRTEDMNYKLNKLLKSLKRKCSKILASNEKLISDNTSNENEEDLLQIIKAHELLKEKHQKLQDLLAVSSASYDTDDDGGDDESTAIDEYTDDVVDTFVGKVIESVDTDNNDNGQANEEDALTSPDSLMPHTNNDKIIPNKYEDQIKLLQKELNEQKAANEQLILSNNELSTKNHELQRLPQTLYIKEQQIATLLKQNNDKDALLSDLQQRLYNKDLIHVQEKTKLSDEMSYDKEVQQALRAENKKLNEILLDKERCIESFLLNIHELGTTVAEKNDIISKQNSIIKDQDITIANLQSSLEQHKQEQLELANMRTESTNLNQRIIQLEIQEIEFLELLIEKEQLHIHHLKKKEEEMSLQKTGHSIITCLSNEETRTYQNSRENIPSLLNTCSTSSSEDDSSQNEIEVYMVNNTPEEEQLKRQIKKKENELQTLQTQIEALQKENIEYKLEITDIQDISTSVICNLRLRCEQLEVTIDKLLKERQNDNANTIIDSLHYLTITSCLLNNEKKYLSMQVYTEQERLKRLKADNNVILSNYLELQEEMKEKNLVITELKNKYDNETRTKRDIISHLTNNLKTMEQDVIYHQQKHEQSKHDATISTSTHEKITKQLKNEISMLQSGVSVLETNLLEKESMIESLQMQYETDLQITKSQYEIQISDYTVNLQQKEKELGKLENEYKLLKDAYVTTKNSYKKMHSELLGYKDSNASLLKEKNCLEVELIKAKTQLNCREDRLNTIKAEIERLTILQHQRLLLKDDK